MEVVMGIFRTICFIIWLVLEILILIGINKEKKYDYIWLIINMLFPYIGYLGFKIYKDIFEE
jgi:hypothetical protein